MFASVQLNPRDTSVVTNHLNFIFYTYNFSGNKMLPWRERHGLADMVRHCRCSGKEHCCASDARFTPKGLMDHLKSKKQCFLHLGTYLYLYTIYRGLRGTGHKALFDVGSDDYKNAEAAEKNEYYM
jgi:hypothetical protein